MPFITSNNSKNTHVDEENPYWISFSDIMSGLLVIFILATLQLVLELAETKKNVNEAIEEITKVNIIKKEMLNEIRSELKKANIIVDVADNYSVIRIPDDQLYFVQGSYLIPKNKRHIVNRIGSIIFRVIKKDKRYERIDTIFIEGHTDSKPARNLKLGNWGLSAHRAITIWRYWELNPEYGQGISELKNTLNENMFSVSGYAETRRIELDDKHDKLKQKKNRRIDIRFTMKSPKLKDLKDISDKL